MFVLLTVGLYRYAVKFNC